MIIASRISRQALGLLLLGMVFFNQLWAATEDTGSQRAVKLPPRSIADISKLLEHYKPDAAAAAKAMQEAGATPPQTDDKDVLFDFYLARARAAYRVGRSSQELADLRQAIIYSDSSKVVFSGAIHESARAEFHSGNLLNAIKIADGFAQKIPSFRRGMQLGNYSVVSRMYAQLGDWESARKALREAESLHVAVIRQHDHYKFGDLWSAQVDSALADVLMGDGFFSDAEVALRRGLSASERFIPIHESLLEQRDPFYTASKDTAYQRRADFERTLSTALLAQGKVVDAEVFARQALIHSLERFGRSSVNVAQSLTQLAQVIAEQGRDVEATKLAEEALRSYQESGSAPESIRLALGRRVLGAALVAQHRYAEGIKMFRDMSEGLKGDPVLFERLGTADLDWVIAMLHAGDQSGAEKMSKMMLDSAVTQYGEKSVRTAELRAFYAITLLARSDQQAAAFPLFQSAIPPLLDQARNDAEASTGTIHRHRRLTMILESYLKLLSESNRAAGYATGTSAEESFRIADIARGSLVQRALTASATRANISDPQLAALARREQDAQQRIGALSGLLTQLLSALPEQQLPKIQAKMREDIDGLKRDRDALKKDIAGKFPDYAELVDPKPATVAQVSKSLKTGEVLLAYYFGQDASYVWALKSDGKAVFAKLAMTRAELAKDVATLRKSLDPGVARIEDIPPFDVVLAHRLYTQLVQPLGIFLADAKLLLVVPHAELGQLPLAVLPTQLMTQPGKTAVPFAGYKPTPWLLRKFAIAQLPSVTSLASLRKQMQGTDTRRAFVGFGDPFFSKIQADSGELKLASAAGITRGMKLRNSPQTGQADSASLGQLPRLPDTNVEITEIGRVLGADPTTDIYLQARATVKAVQEANLSDRRVVMFATHGLVPGDIDGLTQPALALTSPQVTPDGGDGFLTMDIVLGLKLNADWVVLSACNTASGDGSGSEAVSGLGRAFFYAGARALLVSNWPVETEAARLLMTDLFRRQASQTGLLKAEALRQAMLAIADGAGAVNAKSGNSDFSYAHPLFWAPFVVVGD